MSRYWLIIVLVYCVSVLPWIHSSDSVCSNYTSVVPLNKTYGTYVVRFTTMPLLRCGTIILEEVKDEFIFKLATASVTKNLKEKKERKLQNAMTKEEYRQYMHELKKNHTQFRGKLNQTTSKKQFHRYISKDYFYFDMDIASVIAYKESIGNGWILCNKHRALMPSSHVSVPIKVLVLTVPGADPKEAEALRDEIIKLIPDIKFIPVEEGAVVMTVPGADPSEAEALRDQIITLIPDIEFAPVVRDALKEYFDFNMEAASIVAYKKGVGNGGIYCNINIALYPFTPVIATFDALVMTVPGADPSEAEALRDQIIKYQDNLKMAIVGLLIVMILVFAVSVNAQTPKWQEVENCCTQIQPEATHKDMKGIAKVNYWSLPSDDCIYLTYNQFLNDVYISTTNANPIEANYRNVSTTVMSVENPNKKGQMEGFPLNGIKPVRVTTIAIYIPGVGYGLAICDYKNGTVPIRLYVLSYIFTTKNDIEDIKTKLMTKVPNGLPLNPVNQGMICDA
ncbi:hypothetical protein CHUAL_000188 [Chamberlinius hualienensis]